MKRPVTMFFLTLAAACLVLPQNSRAEKNALPDAFENYVCDGHFFTAGVPADWPRSEAITAGRQAKEYGVALRGPQSAEGAYVRISLMYYAAGHRQFKTMEEYILVNSRPENSMPIKGEKYGQLRNVAAGGRKGKMFEVKTFEFIPPYAVKPKKIAVLERKVVLPGIQGGFYVLAYHAPAGPLADANLKIFEKILARFNPDR